MCFVNRASLNIEYQLGQVQIKESKGIKSEALSLNLGPPFGGLQFRAKRTTSLCLTLLISKMELTIPSEA